jgi:hypothetical protein
MSTSENLKKLWQDPTFSGSFSGAKTFQACLKLEKNIDVSLKTIYSVLKEIPTYIIHQRPRRNIKRQALFLNF